MLWEFSSTVTPTSIGGSAVALFIIPMEGIAVGRSTAIVMIATLMDELFYVIITPIIIFLIGSQTAFATEFRFSVAGWKFAETDVFLIGYSFMMLLTLFILVAIFFCPKKFRGFLYRLGKTRLLKRWEHKFKKTGDDILTSSEEFKEKRFTYWLKVYGATVLSWSSRFLVMNFVLMAFNTDISSLLDNLVIYCRQLVMWIVLCISPTPGSSGVAEFAFPLFFHLAPTVTWNSIPVYSSLPFRITVTATLSWACSVSSLALRSRMVEILESPTRVMISPG